MVIVSSFEWCIGGPYIELSYSYLSMHMRHGYHVYYRVVHLRANAGLLLSLLYAKSVAPPRMQQIVSYTTICIITSI